MVSTSVNDIFFMGKTTRREIKLPKTFKNWGQKYIFIIYEIKIFDSFLSPFSNGFSLNNPSK